jgi:hypothetical protein
MLSRWFLGPVALVAVWILRASLSYGGDIYHGTVVDEETGKPLEGVSVTVIWYRTPILQLERSLYFQSAQETVTDAEGKFSLEVAPGTDWSPFTKVVKEHDIIIFKPEFAPFNKGHMPKEFWAYNTLVDAFKKGVTIKLTKLKTNDQISRYTTLSSLGVGRVIEEEIPRLVFNLNQQRKLAGFKS